MLRREPGPRPFLPTMKNSHGEPGCDQFVFCEERPQGRPRATYAAAFAVVAELVRVLGLFAIEDRGSGSAAICTSSTHAKPVALEEGKHRTFPTRVPRALANLGQAVESCREPHL